MSLPFTETPNDDDCYPLDVLVLLNLNIAHPEVPSCTVGTISVAHSPEVAPCYVQVAVCGNWMTDSDGARIAPGFWELMGEDAEEVAELASAATEAQREAADPSKPIAQVGEILRKIGDVLGEVPSNADAVLNVLMDIDSGEVRVNQSMPLDLPATPDESAPQACNQLVPCEQCPEPFQCRMQMCSQPDADARDTERLRSAA